MSFTIETWLGLSVLLNLGLIAWMLGAWRGRRAIQPIVDLTYELDKAAVVLREKSEAILREYGEDK